MIYFCFADNQFKCSTILEEVGSGTLSAIDRADFSARIFMVRPSIVMIEKQK